MSDMELLRQLSDARAVLLEQLGRHEEAQSVRPYDLAGRIKNERAKAESARNLVAQLVQRHRSEQAGVEVDPAELAQEIRDVVRESELEDRFADVRAARAFLHQAPSERIRIRSDGAGHVSVELTLGEDQPTPGVAAERPSR